MQQAASDTLAPDARQYVATISAFAKAGQPKKAEASFKEMCTSRLDPDIFAYTALMNAYARCGDVMGAQRRFQDTVQFLSIFALVQTSVTWPGDEMEGDILGAGLLLTAATMPCKDLLDASLQPDAFCYSSVLNACAQAHESQLAESWLLQMMEVTWIQVMPTAQGKS